MLCLQCYFYSVGESSILRLDPDEKMRFDERGSILIDSTLTSPKTVIELPANIMVIINLMILV